MLGCGRWRNVDLPRSRQHSSPELSATEVRHSPGCHQRQVEPHSWQQTHTRDPLPPYDGFTVPVETDPAEIRTLCRTFEKSDEEGRSLVRLITGAVVKQ